MDLFVEHFNDWMLCVTKSRERARHNWAWVGTSCNDETTAYMDYGCELACVAKRGEEGRRHRAGTGASSSDETKKHI